MEEGEGVSKVHVSLHRDAAHGKAPITGPMRFAPSRRRSDGADIILPAGFDVDLVDGEAIVELDATGPDWCWCAYEPTLRGAIRSFSVPEAGDDEVLEYEGLADVDPSTLEPSPEALAGWTATLDTVRGYRDDVVAVLPLIEPIPGIAAAVHADASTAASAAEEAAAQAAQAGQHRQAAEQAAQTAAADTTTAVAHLITDAQTALTQTATTAAQTITDQTDTSVAQVRAEIIGIDYDPAVGWIITRGA